VSDTYDLLSTTFDANTFSSLCSTDIDGFFRSLAQFPTELAPTDDMDSMDIEFPSLFPTTPTTTTVDGDYQEFSDFFSMDAGANWLCDTES